MTVGMRSAIMRKTRSPELERLIRTLGQVATDLPRILREEKSVAFARLDSVEAFEAHMRETAQIPAHLEALSRAIGRSLQVEGATDHLSRIFRALSVARGVEPPIARPAPDPVEACAGLPGLDEKGLAVQPVENMDEAAPSPGQISAAGVGEAEICPSTGDLILTAKRTDLSFHPIDLNLQKVRDALVPGGDICGRSMYESSRVRLVTARSGGDGPWRFQFRRGSLEWAAQGEGQGLRGVAVLICADRGYIQVPARLLLERGLEYLMRSTGGNPILRPSIAVYGAEAILHPGAMSRTRPGGATKHVFVEF